MSTILPAIAVILALLGVALPFVLSLLPWLGLRPIFRMRSIRWSLLAVAFALVAVSYAGNPSMTTAIIGAGVIIAGAAVPFSNFGNVLVALHDPHEVPVREADLDVDEFVLGFESEGPAKAWPFEMVVRHNTINDRLNEKPVLAVFCGLCRMGIVYDPMVDDRRLTFEAVNSWRRNMLLRDRETRTLWQQATGEALMGELAGSTLEPLGGEIVRWGTWYREHPETTLAVEPGGPRTLLAKFMNGVVATRLTWPGRRPIDNRLPAKEMVAGVTVEGHSRAYPLSLLAREEVVNDDLAGEPLAIVYDTDGDRVRVYRRDIEGEVHTLGFDEGRLVTADRGRSWDISGRPDEASSSPPLQPLPVVREWWFAWAEFQPATSLYGID